MKRRRINGGGPFGFTLIELYSNKLFPNFPVRNITGYLLLLPELDFTLTSS
jgi:hypothetical protein